MEQATRMRDLLRYANFTHIAAGLSDAGYEVSPATVSRWAKGQNVSPRAVKLVEDLLGTKKEPRPEWAEALLDEIRAIRGLLEVRVEAQEVVDAAEEAAEHGARGAGGEPEALTP